MSDAEKSTTTTFTYHDPSRSFEGTPYEAAGKAVLQTDYVLQLLLRSLRDTTVQARNAFMQRELDLDGDPHAELWPNSPEARILAKYQTSVENMRKRLTPLMRAVAYDPKNPPKEA